MELRQIDCFLAVATDLHFGKAAKRLSLAQSSVSEAIHLLEKEVWGQLFLQCDGYQACKKLARTKSVEAHRRAL